MKNTIFILLLLISCIRVGAQNISKDFKGINPVAVELVNGQHLKSAQLSNLIGEVMDSLRIPGLSIAIINDGKLVYHNAFGVKNLETQEPVTKQTIFEAASLSKPLFTYFAMKMVEKGVLDLDKPVHEYLPHPGIDSASMTYYNLITPRMILAHSAGFPNWSDGKPIELAFKPGTGYAYSGEAYQYLAAIIGQQLGVGWESGLDSVFQQEVAIPLGLQHSYFTRHQNTANHKATGHKGGKPTDTEQFGKAFGAGYSLHTEAGDFAKFLMEMINGEHLKEDLLDEMLKEQNKFTEDNELVAIGQTGWSLGFSRRPTENGLRYMHTGNNHDFQSYCAFYKEKGYGLVIFTNSDQIEPFYTVLGKYIGDEF